MDSADSSLQLLKGCDASKSNKYFSSVQAHEILVLHVCLLQPDRLRTAVLTPHIALSSTVQTTLQLLKGYEAQKSNEAFGSVQTHKILVDFGLCEVMTERNIATKPVFLTYAEVGGGACAITHVHTQASNALFVVKSSG